MFPHHLPGSFLEGPVNVAVIGAGGSGSQVLTGLAQLHHAMLALGHPGGMNVVAVDDDVVSPSNVGRQMFYPADVGQYKADVLIHRINMAMGTNWKSVTARLEANSNLYNSDLVIGCVDTRAARAAIQSAGERCDVRYWLDLGNRQHDGQVILGEFKNQRRDKARTVARLPTVADLFPETCDPSLEGEDTGPSCSLAEALEKQSLFVNRGVALYALNLLFELFRYGGLSHHGVFINLKNARTSPLSIDPEAWKRFGYGVKPKRSRKTKPNPENS